MLRYGCGAHPGFFHVQAPLKRYRELLPIIVLKHFLLETNGCDMHILGQMTSPKNHIPYNQIAAEVRVGFFKRGGVVETVQFWSGKYPVHEAQLKIYVGVLQHAVNGR